MKVLIAALGKEVLGVKASPVPSDGGGGPTWTDGCCGSNSPSIQPTHGYWPISCADAWAVGINPDCSGLTDGTNIYGSASADAYENRKQHDQGFASIHLTRDTGHFTSTT